MLRPLLISVSLLLATAVQAQKLVDPSQVAPEFREAAEKRRAEQIRQQTCSKKADAEKVMPRERTAFLRTHQDVSQQIRNRDSQTADSRDGISMNLACRIGLIHHPIRTENIAANRRQYQ